MLPALFRRKTIEQIKKDEVCLNNQVEDTLNFYKNCRF